MRGWFRGALSGSVVLLVVSLASSPAPALLDDSTGAVLPSDDPLLDGWVAEGEDGYVPVGGDDDLMVSRESSEEEPLFVGWTSALPATASGYEPSSEHVCKRGDLQCVDLVIEAMTRRFERLASVCSHNAVFSLVYLRTTEEYRRAVTEPGFFEDPAFVNHEDAVFAKHYFDAFDDWYQGARHWKVNGAWHSKAPHRDDVPPAWQVAFRAADDRAVTGLGDILLGMSAHINRDLPFVLESIGLVKPDGTSRKPDHDKVNEFLNRVTIPAMREAAQRFDPTIDDGNIEATTLDESASLQIVMSWREEAWRNAERLAAAETPAERQLVAQSIEDAAYLEALAIRDAHAYDGTVRSTEERDAYCAEHWDDEV